VIPNPLPRACSLLLLALPGVWAAGRWLSGRIFTDPRLSLALAPGLGVAAWLLAVHVSALVTGSLVVGLFAGTALVALGGALAWARARAGAPAAPGGERRPRSWGLILSTAAATALVAPAALGWAFHDELFLTGHMSIVAQLQNDLYPPVNMTFPEVDLQYHYGFDLLVAMVTALLRLRVDQAIDLVTLAGWAYTWVLLWLLGERTLGDAPAVILPALTLLGGGLILSCDNADDGLTLRMVGLCMVGDVPLNPPLVSYAFQHPFSAGLPLAVCAIHVFWDREVAPRRRFAVLGLLLVALSLCQVALFAALLAAFAFDEVVRRDPTWRARVVGIAIMLGATLLVAPALGGFFARSAHAIGSTLVLRPGITGSAGGDARWLLQTFGLLLPLGVAGLALRREHRALLGSLAFGGIAVVVCMHYRYSRDIEKFGAIAALALGILGAPVVGTVMARSRPAWQRALGIAVMLAVTAPGVAFPAAFALGGRGLPEQTFPRAAPVPPPDHAAAIGWLRGHLARGELVYVAPDATSYYAIWGGLPQVWIDPMVERFGFAPAAIAARQRLVETLPEDPRLWVDGGVRWFVDDGRIPRLTELTRRWQAAGVARERARLGGLAIVELGAPGGG
jgi:hypothetical protein